ncbi:MAG: (2Fe-2S)-binding protein [bacterium]
MLERYFNTSSVIEEVEDKVICHCYNIKESTVKEAIANGADTLEKVMKATKAGTACGGCKKRIEKLI